MFHCIHSEICWTTSWHKTHNIIAKTNHRCEAFHSKQSWLGDKRECRKRWEVGIYTHAPLHERCMQLNVMWHHRLPPANSIHHGKLYQWVSVPTSTPQSFSSNLPFQTALGRAYNLDTITWYPNCNSYTKSCTKHYRFGYNCCFLSFYCCDYSMQTHEGWLCLEFQEKCSNDMFFCANKYLQTLCDSFLISCQLFLSFYHFSSSLTSCTLQVGIANSYLYFPTLEKHQPPMIPMLWRWSSDKLRSTILCY